MQNLLRTRPNIDDYGHCALCGRISPPRALFVFPELTTYEPEETLMSVRNAPTGELKTITEISRWLKSRGLAPNSRQWLYDAIKRGDLDVAIDIPGTKLIDLADAERCVRGAKSNEYVRSL